MLTFTDDWGKVVDWFIFDSLQANRRSKLLQKVDKYAQLQSFIMKPSWY